MGNNMRLGKGLEALLGNVAASAPAEQDESKESVRILSINQIDPNPYQPRQEFDEAEMQELADSIAMHGVIQPILVTSHGQGRYTLVAGERRWRASRKAGLSEIPAIVRSMDDRALREIALIENLQREDLDPVEEALGYRQLMERCSYTQEAAAARLSKSRSAVANSLRLLNLPEKALGYLRAGKLSAGHAKAVLSLESREAQQQAADIIVKEGLNVRQAEALCKKMAKKPRPKRELTLPPLPCEVELSLKEALGTEVHVQYKEGKGSLNVSFYSDEQLRAFANLLGKYEKERNL